MTNLNKLLKWFADKDNVLVSLSGGVDSALVAYAANKELGKNAIAVTADYKTLSSEELDSAKLVAREIGITHHLIEYSELENENFVQNDSKRCFYCRDELSKELIKLSNSLEIETIVDGTQSDDMGDYRPGIDALHGNGIRSPLLEMKFTKELVRTTAKHVGLSIYDKPSNSCLASRIPWGQRVTTEKLVRIEVSEKIIKQKTGIQQVRVRDIDGLARIEVNSDQLNLLDNIETRDEIFSKLKMIGFSDVEINPNGYVSGNLNVFLEN
ncbi:ATP-dependent sacrificial sulfur transferase LarE [Candidatus Nitrosopelagicus sp.]|nr:ATP-dependent sacrificial sulfur transferase LarE [Candidatus Nitrosopelagicus sp.]